MKTSSKRTFVTLLSASALVVATALGGCSGGSGTSGGSASIKAPTPTSSPLWGEPSTTGYPAGTAAALQTVLDRSLAAQKITGIAAAVVSDKGTWAGAAGVDGAGVPIAPTSAFAIASTSKTFVAAEILLLSQEGRIGLDKPVTDYVTLPFDAHGATIRQLATMTSGFPAFPQAKLDALLAKDLTHVFTAAEIVALAADQPAAGTLGGTPVYNGTPYYVLGMVIEKVTGTTLAAALRADLLAPAGLSRIWTQPEEKPVAPLAVSSDTGTVKLVDSSGYLPSLGAASTGRGGAGLAADAPSLARWMYLLYGGHVVDRSLVTVMEQAKAQADGQLYGFGTMVADQNGVGLYGHAGNYVGYTSISMVFSDTATAIAVLVPHTGGADNDVRPQVLFDLRTALQSAAS